MRRGSPLIVWLLFSVLVCSTMRAQEPDRGRIPLYFISADEVEWDYAPTGRDQITGALLDSFAFEDGGKILQTRYRKALYREYTDESFTTLKPRAPEWEHLGFLGPLLRAEVGDTIGVVYRNNTSHPSSLHPHGVFYEKDSEGAPYEDETSGDDKSDDAVPPGGTHFYLWPVPERAGPGPDDPSTIVWMYHSHTREAPDVFAGLLGPILISARGILGANGKPKDVDREFVIAFAQVNENQSWFATENLPFLETRKVVVPPDRLAPFFVHFSINGFTQGNLPVESLTVRTGERVRWYVFASTADFDFHTAHWHGNTVLVHGMRTDVISISPMEMVIADMVPDNTGTWLFHCHVADHLVAGMQARYRVEGGGG